MILRVPIVMIYIVLTINAFAQQSIVKGVVSIHNSETYTGKRQFVMNAQVEAVGFPAQPTITDNLGRFTLIFVGVPEGNTVSFIVRKSPLEVVNTSSLKAITGQKDSIYISMAPLGSIDEFGRKIYNSVKRQSDLRFAQIIKQKNWELAKLKIDVVKNNVRIRQLELDMAELEANKQKSDEKAEELANRYAHINFDDLSPVFKEAFYLFQNGFIDSALNVINSEKITTQVDQIIKEDQRITTIQDHLEELKREQSKRKNDLAQLILLRADLYITTFNFDEAAKCFQTLLNIDSLNVKGLIRYGNFLAGLNEFDSAIYYLEKAKSYELSKVGGKDLLDETNIHNNLGIIYRNKYNYPKSEVEFLYALELAEAAAKEQPGKWGNTISQIRYNLGNLYYSSGNINLAKGNFLRVLDSRHETLLYDSARYYKHASLIRNSLGAMYTANNEFELADSILHSALSHYLFAFKLGLDENIKAAILINLGNNYWKQGRYKNAEEAYIQALGIRKKLESLSSKAYSRYIADLYNNLGLVAKDLGEFGKSEQYYIGALDIYGHLRENDSSTYDIDYAKTLNNLGNLFVANSKFAAAEESLIKAIGIRRKWVDGNSLVFKGGWLGNAYDIGKLYFLMKQKENDITKLSLLQEKVVSLHKQISELYPFDTLSLQNYQESYFQLAWYQLLQNQYMKAEKTIRAGLSIDSKCVCEIGKIRLAHAFLFQGKLRPALKLYKSIKNYSGLGLSEINEIESKGVYNRDVHKAKKYLEKYL